MLAVPTNVIYLMRLTQLVGENRVWEPGSNVVLIAQFCQFVQHNYHRRQQAQLVSYFLIFEAGESYRQVSLAIYYPCYLAHSNTGCIADNTIEHVCSILKALLLSPYEESLKQ